MLENITEEEYNNSQLRASELKKELFNVRYEMALTRDIDKLNDLVARAKSIKKEIARTLLKIKTYELENNIEIKKRGK